LRIFYVVDGEHASGGQYVSLEHVRALRRQGYDARYLVIRPETAAPYEGAFPPGGEVPWQIGAAGLEAEDVVVISEMHAQGALALAGSPARKLIHNQNPFYTFVAFRDVRAIRNWGCEAILTPSRFTSDELGRLGWDGPTHVVRPAVDPVFAAAPLARDRLRVATMPRKRLVEHSLIKGALSSSRPDLANLSWIVIEGQPRAEAARLMAACDIFLSLSDREGLGLPPLEAMATGALVVGYHGQGGREYATDENGDWFEEGGHVEIVRMLGRRLDELAAGARFEARREAGRRTAAAFSQERFEAELAAAYRDLAGPPQGRPRNTR
jgi:hypothetical protein